MCIAITRLFLNMKRCRGGTDCIGHFHEGGVRKWPTLSYATYAAFFCLFLSLFGCESPTQIVWSEEVPSPDGHWIASARTDQTSGPGINACGTGIYLKHISDSGEGQLVLGFANDVVMGKQVTTLNLVWLNPSHLRVTFNKIPEFNVRNNNFGDIEITVVEQSSSDNAS